MTKPALGSLGLLIAFASFSRLASAGEVELRWVPTPNDRIAGYNLYVGKSNAGLLAAAPIDLGQPLVDSSGVASVRLSSPDRSLVLGFEMTSYDAVGRESARSNAVHLGPADVETLGGTVWSATFDDSVIGSTPANFVDPTQRFHIAGFSDGNRAVAAQSMPSAGLVAAEYVGIDSYSWGNYEVSGRLMLLRDTGAAGIAVRAEEGLYAYFGFGGYGGGYFDLWEHNKEYLTCAGSISTGEPLLVGTWYRFRLRVTDPSGVARLRGKAWMLGGIEPGIWQTDCWTEVEMQPTSGEFALYAVGFSRAYWDTLTVRRILGAPEPIPSQ